MHKRYKAALAPAALAAAAAPALSTTQVQAAHTPDSGAGIHPTLVSGNPSCPAGFEEFKVDPPTGGPHDDKTLFVTIVTDGTELAWTSNLGVDLVIVKGGDNANLYAYDPESNGDSALFAPDNSSGGPAGLSHVTFCYDLEVSVSKTADTTFTRTHEWEITKSVDPLILDLFEGQSGDVDWTVAVTKTGSTDSAWAVSGEIVITNPAPVAASVTSVTDSISDGIGDVDVVCPEAAPFSIPAGGSVTCDYSTALPDGEDRVNTATVVTTGSVGGGSDTADVVFGDPTTDVNDSIDVTDTNGESWTTDETTSWTYPQTFTCDEDEGEHKNTATITQTGQEADATTEVRCHDLIVTKDALTSYTRTWEWDIEKAADQESLTLMPGQSFHVNYTVDVSAEATDSDFKVFSSEGIKVSNPAPIDVDLTGVTDVISDGISATVDCGVTFPHTLKAGETLTCQYTGDLPDDADRTNTATATTEFGVDYTGTAAVDFNGAVVTEVDECVDLADTKYAGLAQEVCVGEDDDTTFTLESIEYTLPVMYAECGAFEFENVASLVTQDQELTDESTVTIPVNVPCDTGCTLTQGYWKTHSEHGPAPADEDWFSIGDVDGGGTSEGPDETFFSSGKTWYEVFWTAPAGNVYYVLAHQYMAATLNVMNGASSTPAVDAALVSARNFFLTYTPTQAAGLKGATKNAAAALAATLDAYNNGVTGPGHCSE